MLSRRSQLLLPSIRRALKEGCLSPRGGHQPDEWGGRARPLRLYDPLPFLGLTTWGLQTGEARALATGFLMAMVSSSYIWGGVREVGMIKSLNDKLAKHAAILKNAERLFADAQLLLDHNRCATAFVLAVLCLEEIGKIILDTWDVSSILADKKR